MAEENKPGRVKRRRMKAEDKAKILRAILLDGKNVFRKDSPFKLIALQ